MQQAEIRVRGRVQGVGFRPAVWRLAQQLGLHGDVRNDADGVLIHVAGGDAAIDELLERIQREPPPLARIDRIERRRTDATCPSGFRIVESIGGPARTQIAPDAALCAECAREVLDPDDRRHRYPFATCTHCGPRLSIVRGVPYDRATTTLAPFPLCAECRCEYSDPADRRFHAEALACAACGPRARLFPADVAGDAVAAAAALLQRGNILAVKGLGGYQLACDATNADAVARLRAAKQRDRKPFALMARDLDVIRRYCPVDAMEARLLTSPEAPIVLLRADGCALPENVAPGLTTLGFMLPTTPLHLLLLHAMERPVVMTSGNLTDAPQIIDDAEALERLGGVADHVLTHDRGVATRIDDSVVRVVAGAPRVLRRARGYAPAAITLPRGFADAPDLLAVGGELKATFCLLKDGQAILSQHIGDLEDAATFDDYRHMIAHYAALFDHSPAVIAADPHPDYLAAKYARETGLKLIEVQHHHAHVAACLAENGRTIDAPPVLGIVLDGLGWGEDGTLWGGEFLLADYRMSRRLGTFKPVAMPGGAAAVREPWRNLYAHLLAADVPSFGIPSDKPCTLIETMIRNGVNAPLASSCGRLFDAMAAALGICSDRQGYEGEAAMRLEALACEQTLRAAGDGYPMAVSHWIDPRPMWHAVADDLARGTSPAVMAARFHLGLAAAVTSMACALAGQAHFDTVALTGGCLQNAILLEHTQRRLREAGFAVLTHSIVPANDGGLALGQCAVAAARLIAA